MSPRSHIRQLLYIALYPPPAPVADEKTEGTFEPSTPSKTVAKQVQKSPLIPSVKTTEAALRLLTSFVLTNSPGALGRALPEYVSMSDLQTKERENYQDQEEDSYIAREAMCIQEAKHVWAILKGGMIQRKMIVPMTPKGKGKKRRRDYESHGEMIPFDVEAAAPPVVVAVNAWPVLGWLLMLLEKDERVTENSSLREFTVFSILLSMRSLSDVGHEGSATLSYFTFTNSTSPKWYWCTMGGRRSPRYCLLLFRTNSSQTQRYGRKIDDVGE